MAQTRYLRSVIDLSWRERLIALWYGRLAVSAVVRPEGLEEIKIGPFAGDGAQADHWITEGSRT
jgi:hypothetical protein